MTEGNGRLSGIRSFRLTPRFFTALGGIILLFAFGFVWKPLEYAAALASLILLLAMVVETLVLYRGAQLIASRETGKMFNLGDPNPVRIRIENQGRTALRLELYDELPVQFQVRDFEMRIRLEAGETRTLRYELRPTQRGEYHFGVLNAIASTLAGFCARRMQLAESAAVPVYPSVIQMRKYELLAFARISNFEGIKKIRRIGHSYEFEQIKSYTLGDDIRSINWKATGRRNTLMVNQYEDERSQQIYTVIDKSRNMHMPFNGLSLLDYSINTSLVISNIALRKHDKTGLITFSHRIGSTLPAERSHTQLKKILQALYREKPQPFEGALYRGDTRRPMLRGAAHGAHAQQHHPGCAGAPRPHAGQERLLGAGYRPCLDCHGGQSGAAAGEQGIKKSAIGREEFLKHAWEWKEKYGGVILEQLKKLGASCDWDRTRFTMEPDLSDAVIDVFIDLYKKGPGLPRPAHGELGSRRRSPPFRDEEVVHKEVNSKLYHIRTRVVTPNRESTEGSSSSPSPPRVRKRSWATPPWPCNPEGRALRHLKGKQWKCR
jgi:uncharacterized protein (DUF58 family)